MQKVGGASDEGVEGQPSCLAFISLVSSQHPISCSSARSRCSKCTPKCSWLLASFSSGETPDHRKIVPPSGIPSSRDSGGNNYLGCEWRVRDRGLRISDMMQNFISTLSILIRFRLNLQINLK